MLYYFVLLLSFLSSISLLCLISEYMIDKHHNLLGHISDEKLNNDARFILFIIMLTSILWTSFTYLNQIQ